MTADSMLPCELRIGATVLRKGVSMEVVQLCIDRHIDRHIKRKHPHHIPTDAFDANVEAVRGLLRERCNAGLLKYGVTTERADLSPAEWLQHLQDELLDAAVYAERLKSALRPDFS